MFKKIECMVIESIKSNQRSKTSDGWCPNQPPSTNNTDSLEGEPTQFVGRFRIYEPSRGVKKGILLDIAA